MDGKLDKKLTYSPMSATAMAVSLLLLVASLVFVMPESPAWGLAFASVGLIMLIASFASMDEGPVELVKEYEERERRLWSEFERKADELRKSKEEIGRLREEKKQLEDLIQRELSKVKNKNQKKKSRTVKTRKKAGKTITKKRKKAKASKKKTAKKKTTKRKTMRNKRRK